MSKLDELIKELCPNGVEYKRLGEVIHRHSEKPKNTNIKLVYTVSKDYGIIESLEYWKKTASEKRASYQIYSEDISNYNVIRKNMFAYNPARLNIGSIGCLLEQEEGLLSPMYVIFKIDENFLLPRYVLYYLKSPKILTIIDSKKENGARFRFDFKNWSRILIPIPPLEVQEEIVKILDSYTKSVEELKEKLNEELIARKNQYSWYRDYLLKFENKVEIVKLKNIATEMYRGNGIKREEVRETGIPCVRYGEIYTDYGISFEKTKSYTDENLITNKKYIDYGDILFAITGESVEEIGKSTAYIGKEKCLVGGDILVMKHKQDPVYLSYVLSTENVQKQKSKGKIKSKVVHTNATDIGEIEIPLPPLEVQKRIVEVLNNFEKICNNLNIGLSAEIEARQKQYEFYRNFLLTFKIENCTLPKTRQDKTRQDIIKLFMYIFGYIELELGEILKIKNGSDYKKFNIGNIPVYGSGGIINYIDTYIYDKESVLIPRKGSIGNLFYVDKPFWTVDTIFYTVIDKDIVIPKYVYYYLSKVNLEKLNTAGGVPSLTQTVLNKILIPLPSLEEQQRIVDILDRFDKLCNDISEGLPAEIEARQKQYEYFREKLLTFKNIND